MTHTRVPVHPDGAAGYEVVIGAGASAEAGTLLAGATGVLVVHPASQTARAAALLDELHRHDLPAATALVPDGEAAKQLAIAEGLYATLAGVGLDRQGAIVGLGGGSVTDLAGFVAATWLRGVPVLQIPTTLLAMVDAAVGGKTGVDTSAGKNLVGAFHQPVGVLCDLDALGTLPAAELRSGLAEVAKCGFIADPGILPLLPDHSENLLELVTRAVAVKADVVGRDAKETGPREVLNYGHTLGHAIELVEGWQWRHGEAIAVGMVFAAELSHAAGRLPAAEAAAQRELLDGLGLPVRYRPGRREELLTAMGRDKKARGGRLRFVIVDGAGPPTVLEDPTPELLAAAFDRIGA